MNAIFKPIRSVHMEMPRSRMTIMDRSRDRDKLSKVCRSLFGPVDHNETQKYLDREMAQQSGHQTRKWNFDFQKGVPLDANGRYNWHLIDITFAPTKRLSDAEEYDISDLYPPSLPKATRPSVTGNIQAGPTQFVTLSSKVIRPVVVATPTACATSTTSPSFRCTRKQTLITDFMPSRKRAFESTTKKLADANDEEPPPLPPAKRVRS